MPLDAYETIFQQFPSNSADAWKNKIITDLKGEPFEKLIWHTKEDIDVFPFYTKEDNQQYQLSIPVKQTVGWQITERITVNDITAANKEALLALQAGATSIVFNLQQKLFNKEEITILVKDILLDIAPVHFENYLRENKVDLENLVKNSCPSIVIVSQQETITDELVFALQYGNDKKQTHTCFHFYISGNYFFEIAKLRAFRWLWKQVCELNSQPYELFIRSEISTQGFTDKDEYSNMLRNTTAAMSAILSGCDSLIINSHDVRNENTSFGKRIARNIHHILQHESYFNEIQDVANGSYYIEYLTYQLAKKSWEKFTH